MSGGTPRVQKILDLDLIQDGGAQMRVGMNEETVIDYAEEMVAGAEFPPVIVYHDGDAYWLPPRPSARTAKEPEEPVLFDSKRDYLSQLDHYHEWQRRFSGGES